MINFRFPGLPILKGVAEAEFEKLRPKAEHAVLKGALHMEGAIKQKLTGTRSGRVYKVPGTQRFYTASAPGEPPAAPTGRLRLSITHSPPVWNGFTVSSEVGTKQAQARMLEYGGITPQGGRIEPRPYMEPTFLEQESALDAILAEATQG